MVQGTAGMSKLAPADGKSMEDMFAASIPLGRMGQRSDVALTCVYLASSAASYVSGEPHALFSCPQSVHCLECCCSARISSHPGAQHHTPLRGRNVGPRLPASLAKSPKLFGQCPKTVLYSLQIMLCCAGHVMVVDGAAWMWREQVVSRGQVTGVSRAVEAKSRQVGTATRSKM